MAVPVRHCDRLAALAGAGGAPPRWCPPESPSGWLPSPSECCCARPVLRAWRSVSSWWPSVVTALLLLGWRAVAARGPQAAAVRRCPAGSTGLGQPSTPSGRHADPPSGPSDSSMSPPCSAACCATSASPRPDPPAVAVLPRAKRPSTVSCSSAGKSAAVVVDGDRQHDPCRRARSTMRVASPWVIALRTRLSTASRRPAGQPHTVPASSASTMISTAHPSGCSPAPPGPASRRRRSVRDPRRGPADRTPAGRAR